MKNKFSIFKTRHYSEGTFPDEEGTEMEWMGYEFSAEEG